MAAAMPETGGKMILVVEDDPGIAEFLRLVLTMEGYTVHLTRDGVAALEGILALRPDLVILDVGLPVKDGWGVLEDLSRNPDAPDMPIALLTAFGASEVEFRARSFNVADLMFKPLAAADLTRRVARLLSPTGEA